MAFLRLRLEFIEEPAADCVTGSFARVGLPAADNRVDINRIEFQSVAAPASALRGDHCGAAAKKGVEDDLAPRRSVHDGVGHERNRFHCRMGCEEIALLA